MTSFEEEYFQKFKFSSLQISRYVDSAIRDLAIAHDDKFTEVRFTYCYQALIKIGMAVIAKKGEVKVRSVTGHHIKILNKLSEIMKNSDIFTIGNAMRMKRNKDLYDAAATMTQKEVADYIIFVDGVIQKAKEILK